MHVITLECPKCNSIVAGSVIERFRVMTCPGPGCEETIRFDDLPVDDRRRLRNGTE
jgi:hypothetical protein